MIISFKKPIFFVIFSLFLAIALISISACSTRKETNQPSYNQSNQTEENKLKTANQNAVVASPRMIIKPVRTIDATDHVWGDIKAPVQLIIYSDFECPFCASFNKTIEQIKDYFKDQVVIAFRHNPLRSHPMALTAALASECASEQGQFWPMHDKLFAANLENKISTEQVNSDAKSLDLDIVKFSQCLDTQKYKDKIQEQVLEAINSGVIGTPGNFVNGELSSGAVPFADYTSSDGNKYEGMKKIIEGHLADKSE